MRKRVVTGEERQRDSRRTVLAEQVIGPTNDEPADLLAERLHRLVTLLLLLVGCVPIAALDDRQLVLLVELGRGAEVTGVAEVDQGEVFDEVVLRGRSVEEVRKIVRDERTWMGVPVRITRLLQLICMIELYVALSTNGITRSQQNFRRQIGLGRRTRVLETVALVGEDEANFGTVQLVDDLLAQRLVRNDQDCAGEA